jgi:hypothetical protein
MGKYAKGGSVKTDFNDLQNDDLRKALISFWEDFSSSHMSGHLSIAENGYILSDHDNVFVIFRPIEKGSFTEVERSKLKIWVKPYFDMGKKPITAKYFDSFQFMGNKFLINLKNMYAKGGMFGLYETVKDDAVSIPKNFLLNVNDVLEERNRTAGKAIDTVFEKGGIMKSGKTGGMLVGKRHSQGGIKAINKSTGQPIEMEGGEVVITRDAVSDDTKRQFDGKMMTNREILSHINESGGGVAFADGGEIESCGCTGKQYKYGGLTMSDFDIVLDIAKKYPKEFKKGYAEELSEHKNMFKQMGNKVSPKQAAMLVAATHLKENPEYYNKYKHGGMMKVLNKRVPSFPQYVSKVHYFKSGKKPGYIFDNGGMVDVSKLNMYKTYLKDTLDIDVNSLPKRVVDGLVHANQKMIDNALS